MPVHVGANFSLRPFSTQQAAGYFTHALFKKAVDDEYLMLVISHRLADLRELRGLSQRALAKKTNMPQQEINDIEQGKRNLTVKTINRLAKSLDSVPDIIFREVHE